MHFREEVEKMYSGFVQIGNLGLLLLWHLLHFIVSLWYFAVGITGSIESSVISSGMLKRYKSLNMGKLGYLAIVIESDDAYDIPKVIVLLQWLMAIGVRRVCLYDTEGVLKKSKETILAKLNSVSFNEEADKVDPLLDHKHITLEFSSISDGKEAVAKAANLLLAKYLKLGESGKIQDDKIFSEAHMAEALKSIGYGEPEPDLLLVYGPARCHLGFPAWRIRYTEIVHMGPLKSMSNGSLVKAIYKFTTVCQNYGV